MFRLPTVFIFSYHLILATAIPMKETLENDVPLTTTIQQSQYYNDLIGFETALFIVASAFIAFVTFYVPLQACFFFGNCRRSAVIYKKIWEDTDTLGNDIKIRKRRNMKYLEPILVAIMDTFVESELQSTTENINDVEDKPKNNAAHYPQPEPMLITLAKYFDKYADRDVKKHVKAMLFFLVHILGRLYSIFQGLIIFLFENGWL